MCPRSLLWCFLWSAESLRAARQIRGHASDERDTGDRDRRVRPVLCREDHARLLSYRATACAKVPSLASRYGLVGRPTTYVLDAEGRIAKALSGAQTFETLVRAVEEVE